EGAERPSWAELQLFSSASSPPEQACPARSCPESWSATWAKARAAEGSGCPRARVIQKEASRAEKAGWAAWEEVQAASPEQSAGGPRESSSPVRSEAEEAEAFRRQRER